MSDGCNIGRQRLDIMPPTENGDLALKLLWIAAAALGTAALGFGYHAYAEAAASALQPAQWHASDACKLIEQPMLERTFGTKVTTSWLVEGGRPSRTGMSGSRCHYKLADGSSISVLMRWSPADHYTPAKIAAERAQFDKSSALFGGKPIETVPGIGRAAGFYTTKGLSTLGVYVRDDGYAAIEMHGIETARARAVAIALARQLGW